MHLLDWELSEVDEVLDETVRCGVQRYIVNAIP